MAQTIKGISLSIDLETSRFKSQLSEVKRQINLTTDSVKTFKQALKQNPDDAKFLEAYKKSIDELEKSAQEAKDGLKKLFDEALQKGVSPSDSNFKALTSAISQMDNVLEKAIPKYREFEDTISNSQNSISGVSELSTAASVALGNLWSEGVKFALNKVREGFEKIQEVIEKVKQGTIEVFKTGLDYNIEIERYSRTITSMLGGNEQQAKSVVDSMKQLGARTVFGTDTLLGAAQQLIASGVEADDATKSIEDLAKALAYAGKGDDELARMVQNLNQIKNAGKSSAMDLKQFAYAGVPIYKLLAEYSSEFKSIGKDTKVTYEDIVGALSQAAGDGGKFYEALDVQAQTLGGQIEMIKTNANALAGIVANDLTQSLREHYMPAVNELITAMVKGYDETGLDGLIASFQNGIGTLLDELGNEENVDKFFENASKLLQGIAEAFDPDSEKGAENRRKLHDAAVMFGTKFGEFIYENREAFWDIGTALASAVIDGFLARFSAFGAKFDLDSFVANSSMPTLPSSYTNSASKGRYRSLGFGGLTPISSGGFSSGGITLNASFNIQNGNNIDQSVVMQWADVMTERINENLGAQI